MLFMKKITTSFYYTLLWILLSSSLLQPLSAQPIQSTINQLVNHNNLRQGEVSVSVIDLASGKTIAAHRADKTMIPASAMKVIVTGVALDVLGSDFRFKTELAYDGTIDKNGTLKGNVYIKGFGDPSLGSHHFQKAETYDLVLKKMEKAICDAGIYEIDGMIVGDASYFDTQVDGRTWVWEDLGNYYGAGAWGLNFHENLYLLDLKQKSRLGQAPTILKIRPEVPNMILENELKSAKKGSGDNAYIFGVPYAEQRFIRGTIPVGTGTFTVKGAVPDPPYFAAFHLMKYLDKKGISTRKGVFTSFQLSKKEIKTNSKKTFYTYYSPTLKDIVKITNLKSINLYCEAMLRTLGKTVKKQGTATAGLEVVYDYLEKNKIPTAGLFLEDASGLSPRNAVSAKHLTQFLVELKKNKKVFADLKASLPVGGKSGALKYILKGTIGENRVFAKSGGMSRVRSYTGYAQTKSGKWLAFTIIANNFTGSSSKIRQLMENVMIAICKY